MWGGARGGGEAGQREAGKRPCVRWRAVPLPRNERRRHYDVDVLALLRQLRRSPAQARAQESQALRGEALGARHASVCPRARVRASFC